MKIYKPKKLINGYKVDYKFKDFKLVAIPEKLIYQKVKVEFEDGFMIFDEKSKPLKIIEFEDKFGRGKYRLFYFKWIPVVENVNLFDILSKNKDVFDKLKKVLTKK